MIGGLHILVSALKELSSSEKSNELTSRVLLTDLAVHIVQALSAAVFMHGMPVNDSTVINRVSLIIVIAWALIILYLICRSLLTSIFNNRVLLILLVMFYAHS